MAGPFAGTIQSKMGDGMSRETVPKQCHIESVTILGFPKACHLSFL
jgi:hypothetical protein